MKIKVMAAALMVSLLGCAVLAYLWIDRSISLSYARQSADTDSASKRRLERLLCVAWSGMSENAVLEKLEAEAARHPAENIVVKKEGDVIWFDETKFNFEQGKLKSVDASCKLTKP
jgi:hypothetical protein